MAWADRAATERGAFSLQVIHDALTPYEVTLRLPVEQLRESTDDDWITNTGLRVPGRFRLISGITFVDSKAAPLVQLADVAASLAQEAAVIASHDRVAKRRPSYQQLVAHAANGPGHLNVVSRNSLARRLVL